MTIRDESGFTLVDFDHASGRSVWSYFDGEKTVYRTDYPVAEAIKNNAFHRSEAAGWKGDWHKVASVPLNILHSSGMVAAASQQDDAFLSRWLNDGDNAAWRTKDGRM